MKLSTKMTKNCDAQGYEIYNDCIQSCMKTNYDCERHGERPNRFYYCCLAADAPENIKLVDYSGI